MLKYSKNFAAIFNAFTLEYYIWTSDYFSDISDLLKNLIEIQKENLEIEKQRLELERQTFEYEKTIGTQLLSLFPIVQKITSSELDSHTKPDSTPGKRKRPASSESK